MEINDALRDFQTRYEKTFVWVVPPDSNEESLFHVDRIQPDPTKIASLTLSSPEFGKIILNMGTSHTLKFKYPPVGVFQSGMDAQIFRRLPQKQYKRGICGGNSALYSVPDRMLRQVRPSGELDYQSVSDAYSAVVYSYKDALKMLNSGKFRSVALAHNFSLMLSVSREQHHVLLFWETPIATVKKDTGEVLYVYEAAFTKVIEKVRSR